MTTAVHGYCRVRCDHRHAQFPNEVSQPMFAATTQGASAPIMRTHLLSMTFAPTCSFVRMHHSATLTVSIALLCTCIDQQLHDHCSVQLCPRVLIAKLLGTTTLGIQLASATASKCCCSSAAAVTTSRDTFAYMLPHLL